MLCKFGKYNKITNTMRNKILLFTLILTFFGSCVCPKIHNALVTDHENTSVTKLLNKLSVTEIIRC